MAERHGIATLDWNKNCGDDLREVTSGRGEHGGVIGARLPHPGEQALHRHRVRRALEARDARAPRVIDTALRVGERFLVGSAA